MKNDCIVHSIIVHDSNNNFKHTLTFDNIFSMKCAYAEMGDPKHNGFKYVSKEGKIFSTAHHVILPHIDSDPSGNIIYTAKETTPELKGPQSCSVCEVGLCTSSNIGKCTAECTGQAFADPVTNVACHAVIDALAAGQSGAHCACKKRGSLPIGGCNCYCDGC